MSLLALLGWKTLVFSLAAIGCGLLFFLLRFRSLRIERLAWGIVLLLGIVAAGVTIPVEYEPLASGLAPSEPKVGFTPPNPFERIQNWSGAESRESTTPAPPREGNDSPPLEGRHFAQQNVGVVSLDGKVHINSEYPRTLWHPVAKFWNIETVILALWLTGIVTIILWKTALFFVLLYRLKTATAPDGEFSAEWDRLGGKPNRLLLSDGLGPGVVLTLRGTKVVVPRDLWEEATPDVRTGILRHELAHLRNGDTWWAMVSRLPALVHWFNPIARLVLRRMDEIAERLADEAAFGAGENGAERLAESLWAFYESSPTIVLSRSAFFGGNLDQRIHYLRTLSKRQGDSLMKKTILSLLLALIFVTGLIQLKFVPVAAKVKPQTGLQEKESLAPTQRDRTIAKVVESQLERNHLFKKPTDETLSERGFELFFKALDPGKVYFYQSDVDEFAKRAKSIGKQTQAGDVGFAFDVFNLYLKRVDERLDWAMARLDKLVDLSTDEEIVVDRKMLSYPKTEAEARDRWMKQIKMRLLALKADEIEKLRDKAGKESNFSNLPTTAELQSQVPDWETLQKRLKRNYFYSKQRWHQTNNDDLLEYFLTAIASAHDPHSSYMSPSSFANFMIGVGLNLDGIGATLTSIDGFTVVSRPVPDGPADKSGVVKTDDRIVAVGQGPGGPMVDVFDMKLDDVVAQIRGKAGTYVRLEIVEPGDVDKYAEHKEEGKPKPPTKIVTISRGRVELKEKTAKSIVFEAGQKPEGRPYKIGVIDLPGFYEDFEAIRRGDRNFQSASNDIRKILRQFASDDVDAVIVDLRFNPGGSLQEAVSLTGLFIETGTVSMGKGLGTQVVYRDDRDPSIDWTGPLVVMVNKASASASEVFAGAIKDYRRGLIVGDSSTHGKGSVQMVVDIGNRLLGGTPNSSRYGALKLTIEGYYLPSGNSPQTVGVTSDVKYPSLLDHLEGISESDLDDPLSFEKIAAAKYPVFPYVDVAVVEEVRKKSAQRVAANPDFQKVRKDIQFYLESQAKKTQTLNEKKYFEERERLLAEREETEEDKEKIERNFYMNEVLETTVDYMQALTAAGIAFPEEKAFKGGVRLFN